MVYFLSGAPIIRGLGASVPLPTYQVIWLVVPLFSLAATATLPAFAFSAWRGRWWTWRERLGFSTFVALGIAFIMFLNYWKLLGFRY